MSDIEIEERLRDAGLEFVESHRKAEAAIREAASVGMPPERISEVSALSSETVRAFLRAIETA
jgi:hypothetical protein